MLNIQSLATIIHYHGTKNGTREEISGKTGIPYSFATWDVPSTGVAEVEDGM